jgi:hypothetical protein
LKRQVTVLTVLAAFAVTMIAPLAVQAGSTGRRNTALAATGTAVYLLVKGKTVPGLAVGAGAAYAWKRYNDSRKAETRKRYYRSGYGRGYKYGRSYAYRHRHR